MAIGILPKKNLFDRYPNLEALYGGFVTAIVKGDIRSYDTLLSNLQTSLIKSGTYFVVEASRILTVRTLFKKVYGRCAGLLHLSDRRSLENRWILNGKSPRLALPDFSRALKFMDYNLSSEEMMCLIANIIDKVCTAGVTCFLRVVS